MMQPRPSKLALLIVLTPLFMGTAALSEPERTETTAPPVYDAEHNGGVGMAIGLNEKSGKFTIVKVIPGSSAAKADVAAGDTISAVDGVEVDGLSINDLVAKVRGKLGSTVKVTTLRGDKKLELTLVRAAILATWEPKKEPATTAPAARP